MIAARGTNFGLRLVRLKDPTALPSSVAPMLADSSALLELEMFGGGAIQRCWLLFSTCPLVARGDGSVRLSALKTIGVKWQLRRSYLLVCHRPQQTPSDTEERV